MTRSCASSNPCRDFPLQRVVMRDRCLEVDGEVTGPVLVLTGQLQGDRLARASTVSGSLKPCDDMALHQHKDCEDCWLCSFVGVRDAHRPAEVTEGAVLEAVAVKDPPLVSRQRRRGRGCRLGQGCAAEGCTRSLAGG